MTLPQQQPIPVNAPGSPVAGLPAAQQSDPLDTRALETGGKGPLRKWNAILVDAKTETRQSRANKPYGMNILSMTDLVVEQSIEPVLLPTYQFEFFANRNKGSEWGVFAESINNVVDSQYTAEQLDPRNPAYVEPGQRPGLKQTYGKRYFIVLCDGIDGRPPMSMMWDSRSKQELPTPVWKVYKIEGIGEVSLAPVTDGSVPVVATPAPAPAAPVNALQQALNILDGKDAATFNTAALADPIIMADAQVMSAIQVPMGQTNSFLDTVVKSGMVTMDTQGIFHKVQTG